MPCPYGFCLWANTSVRPYGLFVLGRHAGLPLRCVFLLSPPIMGRVRVGLLLEIVGQVILVEHYVAGAQNLREVCVCVVQ